MFNSALTFIIGVIVGMVFSVNCCTCHFLKRLLELSVLVEFYNVMKLVIFYQYFGQLLVPQLWPCCPAHWFVE